MSPHHERTPPRAQYDIPVLELESEKSPKTDPHPPRFNDKFSRGKERDLKKKKTGEGEQRKNRYVIYIHEERERERGRWREVPLSFRRRALAVLFEFRRKGVRSLFRKNGFEWASVVHVDISVHVDRCCDNRSCSRSTRPSVRKGEPFRTRGENSSLKSSALSEGGRPLCPARRNNNRSSVFSHNPSFPSHLLLRTPYNIRLHFR